MEGVYCLTNRTQCFLQRYFFASLCGCLSEGHRGDCKNRNDHQYDKQLGKRCACLTAAWIYLLFRAHSHHRTMICEFR
jgi:hypothetical protein